MAEALRYEKADELGNPIKRLKTPNPATARPRKPRQVKKPRIDTSVDIPTGTDVFVVSSDDDDNYETATGTESSTSIESGLTDTDWPGEYDSPYRLLRGFPEAPATLNAEVRYASFIHVLSLLTH
jgi:hypothetical protein